MKAMILAGCALFCAAPALAERVQFTLRSASETKSYGVLLTAPESDCRHVRYRVMAGGVTLGHTPPLEPGEAVVLRVGQGYAAGDHALVIAAIGCAAPAVAPRRVTLAKASPDHGWRAARVMADHQFGRSSAAEWAGCHPARIRASTGVGVSTTPSASGSCTAGP